MQTVGRHLIAEYYGCNRTRIDQAGPLRSDLLDAAESVGATVLSDAFHQFDPHGVSGTVVIAESHLSIHTWPESGYVAVDVFTCGGLDPRPAFALLAARLEAKSGRVQEILRGLPEEIGDARELVPGDVELITTLAPLDDFLAGAAGRQAA